MSSLGGGGGGQEVVPTPKIWPRVVYNKKFAMSWLEIVASKNTALGWLVYDKAFQKTSLMLRHCEIQWPRETQRSRL